MADSSSTSRDKGGHGSPGESRPATAVQEKAQEGASAFAAKTKQAVAQAADKGKDMAGSFAQEAQNIASKGVDKTKDLAASAMHKAEDVASSIGHSVGTAVDSVGGSMKSVAGTIRKQAPDSGVLGSAATGLAGGLEAGGAYLQEHDLQGMGKDVAELIRRYPLQAILTGIGVGIVIGRATRSNHGH